EATRDHGSAVAGCSVRTAVSAADARTRSMAATCYYAPVTATRALKGARDADSACLMPVGVERRARRGLGVLDAGGCRYSYLSAWQGSNRVARRAGHRQAASETTIITPAIDPIVIGSRVLV